MSEDCWFNMHYLQLQVSNGDMGDLMSVNTRWEKKCSEKNLYQKATRFGADLVKVFVKFPQFCAGMFATKCPHIVLIKDS